MEVMNILVDFFGLQYSGTTFSDFIVWFMMVLCGVLIVAYIFKLFFYAVFKIQRDLK